MNFGVRDAESDTGSLDYSRIQGGVGYTLPKPIGSARVTLELDLEQRLYENYPTLDTRGFFIVMTEQEREDLTGSVGVQFFFDQVEYYGFSPTESSHATPISFLAWT